MKSECVALLLVLSLCAAARPATFYVDDDAPGDFLPRNPVYGDPNEDGSAQHPFDDIQEAIGAVVDGDTIIVAPGRYLSPDPWEYDEINFNGKSIRVLSSAPTDFSVVEETILCGVVIFDGTEDANCLLQGFKIQNHGHGGILGNRTQASVSHCVISGNGPCGATVLKDVEGEVRNCLIVDNTTFHDCGVLPVVSGCPTLINCTIANNISGVQASRRGLPGYVGVNVFHNCIIYGNQGTQVVPWSISVQPLLKLEYCLIQDWWNMETTSPRLGGGSLVWSADPYFVRWGHWEDVPSTPSGAGDSSTTTTGYPNKVLSEGDYHLQSQGWRWIAEPEHGSNRYYDLLTSSAVDAGDPLDGLGEEPERVPDDPEGAYGFNHAIDLGVYGGTTQASLAPTEGEAPGVGAVDLLDYWPLYLSNRWSVHDPQGTPRAFAGSCKAIAGIGRLYSLWQYNDAPGLGPNLRCYCVEGIFYMTSDFVEYYQPLKPPEHIQAQYPQYLVPGSVVQAPYDPFTNAAPVEYRSVLVARGTLAEVLAGTSMDPNRLLDGAWPDVIALKEMNEDGTASDPMAIFARGLGPLWIAGQPIEGATIGLKTFGTVPGFRPGHR
jgi:hypothetical protein